MGKPPFMRLWGPEFQVGQEGVNGSPPSEFHLLQSLWFRSAGPRALPRLPPRAHAHVQPPHPRLTLARTHDRVGLHARSELRRV